MHAVGIEDEILDLGFGTLHGDLPAIQDKGDPGGVADAHRDFPRGADGCVRRSDESFLGYELAIGENGHPGVFSGANDQR